MAQAKGSHAPSSVTTLLYQLIRNTTSPDEAETGVKSLVANLPAQEILKLNTRDNLRAYIPEYDPRKRNKVHDAIRDTIDRRPARFITRNSGFVITASAFEVDDNKKTLKLTDASLINGAQSQGEIRQAMADIFGDDDPNDYEPPFHVRAEIVVDPDQDEVTETAIARNTATPVKSISQAGARGQLDELEAAILSGLGVEIQKKETDQGFDTRKIIQYARLLMPPEVSGSSSPSEMLRPYKNPEQCLTDFCRWYDNRKTSADDRLRYEFTVAIAADAVKEYDYWEAHAAWNGQHLWEETKKGGRACRRDGDKVVWVSPGLLFPIMGALSAFVAKNGKGQWRIKKPKQFKPENMIKQCVAQFRAHNSDPMVMGRSEAAYEALRIYPQTLVAVMQDMEGDD